MRQCRHGDARARSARRREIAVRVALGATRGRLVRQLVSEGLLIGVASGVVGLFLTYAGLDGAFRTSLPEVFFQRLSINAEPAGVCLRAVDLRHRSCSASCRRSSRRGRISTRI